MNSKALDKAKIRLRVARKAIENLPSCDTYATFSENWYSFLHAAKGIYTTLEQGSKTSRQARQWFGAKNQFRKQDELLRYVTEARNDDEHGIEDVTNYVSGRTSVGVMAPGYSTFMTDDNGNVFENCGAVFRGPFGMPQPFQGLRALDGKPILVQNDLPHAKLVPVKDRAGREYYPPTVHLGLPLQSGLPLEVGRLMVKYLEDLMTEAENFRMPSP